MLSAASCMVRQVSTCLLCSPFQTIRDTVLAIHYLSFSREACRRIDISYRGLGWLGASNDRVDPLCNMQLTRHTLAQAVPEKVGGRLYGLMS